MCVTWKETTPSLRRSAYRKLGCFDQVITSNSPFPAHRQTTEKGPYQRPFSHRKPRPQAGISSSQSHAGRLPLRRLLPSSRQPSLYRARQSPRAARKNECIRIHKRFITNPGIVAQVRRISLLERAALSLDLNRSVSIPSRIPRCRMFS